MNEPTKIFVGVTTNGAANKARYVSKVYVGDSNSVARKVRKGYIGDQYNKARLFFNALPELEKQTVSGTLYRGYRNAETDTNGAELANNAVFGGRYYSAGTPDWYGTRINSDLTVHPISTDGSQYLACRMFTPLGANATSRQKYRGDRYDGSLCRNNGRRIHSYFCSGVGIISV